MSVKLFPADYQFAKIKKIDEKAFAELSEFYDNDPTITRAKKFINERVFKGTISINTRVGAVVYKGVKDAIMPEAKLVELFMRALDWKRLYGMCPYRINQDVNSKRRYFVIPQVDTGAFYQLYDRIDITSRVFFLENTTGYSESWSSSSKLEFLEKNGLHVYIWPGYEPRFNKNTFHSEVAQMYEVRLKKDALVHDACYSNRQASRPPLVTTATTPRETVEDYDENALRLEDTLGLITGPRESQERMRNSFRQEQADNRSGSYQVIDAAAVYTKRYKAESKSSYLEAEKPYFATYGIVALPSGETPASIPIPKAHIDMFAAITWYDDVVYQVMGLTRKMLEGDFARQTVGSSEMVMSSLRALIESLQKDINTFFQDVYTNMYGAQDDFVIIQLLNRLNMELATLPDFQDKRNMRRLELEARKVLLEQHFRKRDAVEVVFGEQPLVDLEDPNMILTLMKEDVLTRKSGTNMIMKKLGRDEVSSSEWQELERNYKHKQSMEEQKILGKGQNAKGISKTDKKKKKEKKKEKKKKKEK